MVGNDLDSASALVDAAGRRVAIEAEAGAAAESIEFAAGVAANLPGHRLVRDARAGDGIIYAGTDVESAVGVAEALANENPRARIVFPDELTRDGIAERLPRAVRRRSRFVTSAPPADRAFEDAFEAQYGRRPDPYAVLGYRGDAAGARGDRGRRAARAAPARDDRALSRAARAVDGVLHARLTGRGS